MQGVSNNFVHDAAVRMLRRAGYFVGLPRVPPLVGSVWVPSRGLAIRRTVLSVERWRIRGRHVVYLPGEPGTLAQTCSLGTWTRWVTRSRARVLPLAA